MPKGIKGFQKGNDSWKNWKSRPDYSGKNNPNYGNKLSEESKNKIGIAHSNDKSSTWKGEMAGKSAIHRWVKKRINKPDICPKCGIFKATDLSNTGHTYTRNIDDWEWLCRKCHFVKDGGWGYFKYKP